MTLRGFRPFTRESDIRAFYHPLFRRNRRDLCAKMVCDNSGHQGDEEIGASERPMQRPNNSHVDTVSSLPGGSIVMAAMITPEISNDESLREAALHKRDEIERSRAYKAMLYEAYCRALKDGWAHCSRKEINTLASCWQAPQWNWP